MFRFNHQREIGLYQEAIAINPWQYEHRHDAWQQVATNTMLALGLSDTLTVRNASEKIDKQIEYYRKQNRKNIQK